MPGIRNSRSVLLGAGLLLTACADGPTTVGPRPGTSPAFSVRADISTTTVFWHAQQASLGRTGVVAGASASLVRNANGISFRLSTNSLTPGNAYTLWLVVINNPSACTSRPCSAPDIFNPATQSQVRYAAGTVAGASGNGTFAGAVQEGPLSGWLSDRVFQNSMGVDVHLVVNDHGPMLPEFMPDMIQTYRGGCSNSSPFPGIFPATALADGAVGPNICRLYQAATFDAP